MQLKKDPEETAGTGKLINPEFFEKEDKVIDPSRKRLSDDYSRSGTNTGYAGTIASDYDAGIERNSFRMSKEDVERALSPTEKQKREQSARFLKVSEFIMYVFYIAMVVFLAVVSMKEQIDIIHSLHNLPVVLIILEAYIIFDAILVYNLGEKKMSLFIFAIFLGFLYPAHRRHVLAGNGFGVVCSILVVFACIMLGVNLGRATSTYGKMLMLESEHTRHEVVALYEQIGDNGHHIGPYLTRKFTPETAEVNTEKDTTTLTMSGNGRVYFDSLGTKAEDTVDTKLVFTKTFEDPNYVLTTVFLNGIEVNDNMMKQYWNIIEKGM